MSTGEKAVQEGGPAVVGSVAGGIRGQAPGQSSSRKKLEKCFKKFLEKTVGVWSFPCVNSYFWAIFLAVIFMLLVIPFIVVAVLSYCEALFGLGIWQGIDLLIVAIVCTMYLCGHCRESACCINSLNSIIVLSVAGCLAGTILFIIIAFSDSQCKKWASLLGMIAALVQLFIFMCTCCGSCCYLKITGKTSSDRHYCCPKLKNCPGNGFGEDDV